MTELVSLPNFGAVAVEAGTSLCLTLTGDANSTAIEPLGKALAYVHGAVTDAKIPKVVVDLRGLEFMNSSCFKCLVSWITLIQEAGEADHHYAITFQSNTEFPWQRRSLRSLTYLAPSLLSVET